MSAVELLEKLAENPDEKFDNLSDIEKQEVNNYLYGKREFEHVNLSISEPDEEPSPEPEKEPSKS